MCSCLLSHTLNFFRLAPLLFPLLSKVAVLTVTWVMTKEVGAGRGPMKSSFNSVGNICYNQDCKL